MRRAATRGMTLVELLVVMALMGVIMVALVNFFSQSSRVSTQSSSRAELQQETLNVQQLLAARLKAAWYVFPQGQVFNLGSGELRKNPVTTPTSGSWTVGTHPILAMILPPKELPTSTNCVAPTSSGTGAEPEEGSLSNSTGGENAGCYRFFAYYPVKRSQWTGNTTGAGNPGTDSANGDTWVIAEYRDHYYATTPPDKTGMPAISPNRSRAYLLADYVAPTVATTGFTTTTPVNNTYTMFSLLPTGTSATVPVTGVTINLATTRNSGGKVLRLPGATSTYSITVYPANLGKIAVN